MGEVNITSTNQSGGITAQHVTTGNSQLHVAAPAVPPAESRSRRAFWWIFGIAGFLAACATVYKFFQS